MANDFAESELNRRERNTPVARTPYGPGSWVQGVVLRESPDRDATDVCYFYDVIVLNDENQYTDINRGNRYDNDARPVYPLIRLAASAVSLSEGEIVSVRISGRSINRESSTAETLTGDYDVATIQVGMAVIVSGGGGSGLSGFFQSWLENFAGCVSD